MLRLNVFIQVSADNRAAVMEAAKELVCRRLEDHLPKHTPAGNFFPY